MREDGVPLGSCDDCPASSFEGIASSMANDCLRPLFFFPPRWPFRFLDGPPLSGKFVRASEVDLDPTSATEGLDGLLMITKS